MNKALAEVQHRKGWFGPPDVARELELNKIASWSWVQRHFRRGEIVRVARGKYKFLEHEPLIGMPRLGNVPPHLIE